MTVGAPESAATAAKACLAGSQGDARCDPAQRVFAGEAFRSVWSRASSTWPRTNRSSARTARADNLHQTRACPAPGSAAFSLFRALIAHRRGRDITKVRMREIVLPSARRVMPTFLLARGG